MQRKNAAPMTVLYARQELTIPEVGIYAQQYGAQMMAEVEQYGLQVVGPWVFMSYNLPKNAKQRYTAEFCLPIDSGETYVDGRFAVKALGSFPCAYAEYRGKRRQLFTQGYQPLVREIVAANLPFTGESREIYHSWIGPNSSDNRIEIQFGVASELAARYGQ